MSVDDPLGGGITPLAARSPAAQEQGDNHDANAEPQGSMRILLIEDEPRIAEFLLRALRAEGCLVTHAADGLRGLELARSGGFDVLVLDLMLPGMAGKDVCSALRAEGVGVPILMLSALATVENRVEGLRLGADDYLGKPFSLDELIARVEAMGRRSAGRVTEPAPLEYGPFSFDPVALEVLVNGARVDLTVKERGLICLLMSSPGRAFSRERILGALWTANDDPMTNIIDVYVARLRRKLGAAGAMIETVRGTGYRLRRVAERRPDLCAPPPP